jgi:hypothetical protein
MQEEHEVEASKALRTLAERDGVVAPVREHNGERLAPVPLL